MQGRCGSGARPGRASSRSATSTTGIPAPTRLDAMEIRPPLLAYTSGSRRRPQSAIVVSPAAELCLGSSEAATDLRSALPSCTGHGALRDEAAGPPCPLVAALACRAETDAALGRCELLLLGVDWCTRRRSHRRPELVPVLLIADEHIFFPQQPRQLAVIHHHPAHRRRRLMKQRRVGSMASCMRSRACQ